MNKGSFYFLTDEYCEENKKYGVMQNKETDNNGHNHNRPCYYCFVDNDFPDIYWMIPVSSKIEKYETLLKEKLKKYPVYDGLEFGYFKGNKTAFLIQNICPVKCEDISEEYLNQNGQRYSISSNLEKKILSKARKIVRLSKIGKRSSITNILSIYNKLKEQD